MKLVTFVPKSASETTPRPGVLTADNEAVADLQTAAIARSGSALPYFTDMLKWLEGSEEAFEETQRVVEFLRRQSPPGTSHRLDSVVLLAPVPLPRSIRDFMAFEKHIVQATRTVAKWRFPPLATLDTWAERLWGRPLIGAPKVWYERPIYYKSNTFSVVGPEAEIRWPRYTERLDYELEFGAFIGRAGRDIPKEEARQHIVGYTIFNDFSARDIQLREMQGRLGPAKGKDFDTGNAMGPYLVTADEVPDPYNLKMVARVNGEEWSRGSSADMHFTFEDMITYVSQDETLYPGEFIGSGTVGTGSGLELDRWLKPGDVVELEVEHLGVLRNRVVRP
ncbi:MAG: fumarylacetoacetate hydrolase family protein [Proteobacteria bacterium]|nr:fumarylacetoacetate hydrolase family protein [Pseudomonadota bacterium]NIS68946.1 fumarylacetoacetate hydrolase family protein [Pseudomonadota bacterium]